MQHILALGELAEVAPIPQRSLVTHYEIRNTQYDLNSLSSHIFIYCFCL
jgi:hypothetical protein